MKLFFIVIIITTAILMFVFPSVTTSYAKEGLLNWFYNVLPALYPFMVIQSILISLKFDEKAGKLLKPILKPLFPFNENAYFVIPIGFLCGFPMGAIVTTKLYREKKISKNDAELLLAFCNNIGPIYTLTMILPLFQENLRPIILILMYGIPFIYGIIITNLQNRKLKPQQEIINRTHSINKSETKYSSEIGLLFTSALHQSTDSILMLGGCMIFFSILRVFLQIIPKSLPEFLCIGTGILEIGSFINILSDHTGIITPNRRILILSVVITGGLSCIMQTMSFVAGTDLSLYKYLFHKTMQTLIWLILCIFLFVLL